MSSSSSPEKYDVFLSFRGEDTRRDFTSHLFDALRKKSIRAYMDRLLERGEQVWPELSKAIDNSQVSIVIFSENYATSRWCLEELVRILHRRKDQGQIVIPVFYETDPSHIRYQQGTYAKAFEHHEGGLGDSEKDRAFKLRIKSWREALTEAANISGWDSRKYNDYVQLIQDIVKDVSEKRNLRSSVELKGLIGKEEICGELESYMDKNNKVRVIGIWGMAGIGKTTIAKVLFARHFPKFDNVCFVANVKEYSLDRLLSELLKEPVTGMAFDMSRLNHKKIFIVLDDVSSLDQLLEDMCKEFHDQNADSRLIITTRNKQLLEGRVDMLHIVQRWKDKESLELFCFEVFKKMEPPNVYKELAEKFVKYAGGLPLALKVFGSNLRSKKISFWESNLKRLVECPDHEIQKKLKVSYDTLHEQDKNIFLDIAFFFNGEDTDHVKSILDACGFEASCGIDILVDKALITISYNNIIEMHDLLQKMAFEIEIQECSEMLGGRRRRLRDIKEIRAILQNNKGTDAIEGITVDLSQIKDLKLRADTFSKMNNLRFLRVHIPSGQSSDNVFLPKDLKPFSDKLRYFEWTGYPLKSLPPKFCAKFLVDICMPHSKVKKLWEGVQELYNLEAIDLRESKQLQELPDLSKASRIKWVNLSGCDILIYLHSSLLSSDTLVTLILDGCKNLCEVKSTKQLKSLQNISVNGCSTLREFSVSSDLIENLDLSKTGINTLDESILPKLRWLNLEGVGLKHLLTDLSSLTSLTSLKLSNSGLVVDKDQLHVLFDGFQSLEDLHLMNCSNLFELPDNLGALSKLYQLRLDGSSVKSLPTSIKNLEELEILSVRNCRELQKIPELPPLIKELDALNCDSLEYASNLESLAEMMVGKRKHISFKNNSKLDVQSIMKSLYLIMLSAAFHNVLVKKYRYDVHSFNYNSVEACLPGSEFLMESAYATSKSSSIEFQLPETYSKFLGFIYYVVLSPSIETENHGAKLQLECHVAGGIKYTWMLKRIDELRSDHVYMWYDPYHCDILRYYNKRSATLEFSLKTYSTEEVVVSNRIKECGVHFFSVSQLHSVLLELKPDSESKRELEKEFEDELRQKSQVQMANFQPTNEMNMERGSDENESDGIRNQTIPVTDESKSVIVGPDTSSTDHFSDEEKNIQSAAYDDTMTGAGRGGHKEKHAESTKDMKSKDNEETPTESDIALHLPVDLVEEENTSDDMSFENYYEKTNIEEVSKQQPMVHSNIHGLNVEEPYQEKENEQMSHENSEVEDESDDDPFAELQGILLGSQKSLLPKAACSPNNAAVMEALHNLQCLLDNSLENILRDVKLQRQLQVSLECIEQAPDKKVSPGVAELVKIMSSSKDDLFKDFASARKVVEDHTCRLQHRDELEKQMRDAMEQKKLLKKRMNQYKLQVEKLDQEEEDLCEKIRVLEEKIRKVKKEQNKLEEAMEECDNEKKKLNDEGKSWIPESKELMLEIKNNEVSYNDAITKQEELNEKWEDFRTSLAHISSKI